MAVRRRMAFRTGSDASMKDVSMDIVRDCCDVEEGRRVHNS